MILERGNMWDVFGKTDLFMITTNPIRRNDGAVVMGRGIAKEASTRYPRMPYDFGYRLAQAEHWQAYEDALHPVNIGIIDRYDEQPVGWFMVKHHWRSPADVTVIDKSARLLAGWANGKARLIKRIDLNFPGIGNGKLDREEVLPLLQQLPDNVHVWEYA